MITDINREDRLVQQTFADHLRDRLGWDSVYAFNTETFGPNGTLGRASERDVVLLRDLREALQRLNSKLPESAIEQAVGKLTRVDFARSLGQHNREFYAFILGGVPVDWRDATGETQHALARVIDFRDAGNNHFLAARAQDSRRSCPPLQPARRPGLLRQRFAAGVRRAEGRLSKHPGGF